VGKVDEVWIIELLKWRREDRAFTETVGVEGFRDNSFCGQDGDR
jgi:hypothetical protein